MLMLDRFGIVIPVVCGVISLAVGYAVLRSASWQRPIVGLLASWTVAVWVVRSIGIASADHGAAFVAVHLVLAIVSGVLSVLAIREASGR